MNHQNQKQVIKQFKTQNLNKAFSLIELSIVILIIGILVAGVTQSSRLVNQFRLTSARNITLSSPLP
ncbi:MAG: prepilin-type N-terminal cleavage/methylation domain-containing protein, partial [Alphaproteobacteria bacterium]